MIRHLLEPFILGRLALSAAAIALLCAALPGAARAVRGWRAGATSETQIAHERRAELVAAVVRVALWLQVAALFASVLAGDRLSHVIRGAMCAYGVFDSAPFGFLSLGTSIVAAFACAGWMMLHRLDLSLRAPVLSRIKLAAVFLVAPLVLLDGLAALRFFGGLDFEVVASCCSTSFDGGVASLGAGDLGAMRSVLVTGTVSLALVTIGLGAVVARRGSVQIPRALGFAHGVAAAVTGLASLATIVFYVAPYAYETPHHSCPFCLLHQDLALIGYPLFVALFVGTVSGAFVAIATGLRGVSDEPDAVDALSRTLARRSSVAFATALLVGGFPVVRYLFASHGASLFG